MFHSTAMNIVIWIKPCPVLEAVDMQAIFSDATGCLLTDIDMSSMSSQEPRSAKSIYGGILDFLWSPSFYPVVAAVTTIAVSLVFLRKKGTTRQGHPDISQPQFVRNPYNSITRPQPNDRSPNERHLDSLVPLQATSESHTLGDRDVRNKEATRNSKPSVSIAPVAPSDHHGIQTQPEVLLVTPPIDRGDVQAVDEENLDTSISKEALAITKEPRSVNSGDRVVQREEAPSMLGESNASDRMAPTQNPRVDTGGGAYIEYASFTGGGNAFGKDSIVISIRTGDGQFTDDQRKFICDHMANLTLLPDINNNLKKHALTQSIISLPCAEAAFNDYQNETASGPCFTGTRVALLQMMADWVTDSSKSGMYVLSGLAGIGKSTVAYTIASRAAYLNLLGASFFFSRNVLDRKNAKKLFTTIAHQLCLYNEEFSKVIGEALLEPRGVDAAKKSPQEQLQVLILEPLQSIVWSRSRPVLVVVDALDECDEGDRDKVVMGLSELVRLLPSFKVILTTRPQSPVNPEGHGIFHLQDIEGEVVDGDIRLYLEHRLSLEQVQKHHRRWQWCASDKDIDSLVRIAGRLFVIASTAARYILDKYAADPAGQMKKLLCAFNQGHTLFSDLDHVYTVLDHFYTVILRDVVPANCNNHDIVSCYRSVVGTIIFIQRPLPVSTLGHLIDIDVEKIHAVLDNLQSVILLGEDKVPRIYNQSFSDYLTVQAHCKDPNHRIDPTIGHTDIATRCFMIMNEHLKYNILGLKSLARFMNNEDGLKEDEITPEQVQEKIPQRLQYACVYWANHIKVANIEDVALISGLEKFVDKHILHWFEVLSLIGLLDSAHRAIGVVLKLLVQFAFTRYVEREANKVTQESTVSDLHQHLSLNSQIILGDALRFISKFHEVIEQSALHTYYSALPFTPTHSLLYRRYIREAMHNICNIEGGPEKWDALVANLSHEEHVKVIKFSPDSTLLVSCSEEYVDERLRNQGKLKIWDAATGTPISTIPGHRSAVANDFSMVTSSEDKTIMLYAVNGSAQGATFTTSSKIEKLAFSSGSSQVAAALSDGSIRLWDSGNAELKTSIFDEFEGGGQLEFSPSGTRLAYSSTNGIVKLRDGISGEFIADLQCGLRRDLYFAFSGDGSQIASLSRAHGLKLWNSESGKLVGAIQSVVDWCGLAISANGSFLATSCNDEVHLWSANCGNLAQIEVLETGFTLLMAFSRGDILAIATDHGIVGLYNVETRSFISTLSFGGSPTALAFSPDSTRFAVGSKQGIVYLWNIKEIEASSLPSSMQATGFPQLAFSRDCSRLACGFYNGAVELCGTGPTKSRIGPPAPRWNMLQAILFHIYPQSRQCHTETVTALGFGPDDRLFASGSSNGTIKLWNGGDGALRGTFQVPIGLQAVALSDSMLVAAGDGGVTLWSLDTLKCIDDFKKSGDIASTVSIAKDSTLIAAAFRNSGVSLLDVVNHTTIATFHVSYAIHTITFLPDNSLVAQSYEGIFLLLNKNEPNKAGPTLPNTPLWRGVPVWHCWDKEQHYFAALFPQHKSPVPVLRIPREIHVMQWTQGSSMIALGCKDGRVILLRPPTNYVS